MVSREYGQPIHMLSNQIVQDVHVCICMDRLGRGLMKNDSEIYIRQIYWFNPSMWIETTLKS